MTTFPGSPRLLKKGYMTTYPGSPRLLKGSIVLIDPESASMKRVIVLKYNPETLNRTLQVQGGGEGGERSEALRLLGLAVETISLEAEIYATDQMEEGDPTTAQFGIHQYLAVLRSMIYPPIGKLQANNRLARPGTLKLRSWKHH